MSILFEPNPSTAYWLTLAVTVLLPLAVGLITKFSTSSGLKAILLLAASAATALCSNLLAVDGTTDVGPLVTDVLTTFVIAVAIHYGFWKPTEATALAQSVLVKDNQGLAA